MGFWESFLGGFLGIIFVRRKPARAMTRASDALLFFSFCVLLVPAVVVVVVAAAD